MITKEKNSTILASYVTIKELYNSKKYRSSYQILAEFIKYIVVNEKIYSFALIHIRDKMIETFGFKLPVVVLKTAIKNCDFIAKSVDGSSYNVDFAKLSENAEFEEILSNAEKQNYTVIDEVVDFVRKKHPETYVVRQEIIDSLVSFLADEDTKDKYYEEVSEYILVNSGNDKVQEQLKSIKEGVILYIGLNYNISETGSIKNELFLYLDMEVLFNIAGLNGELYQNVATDLLDVIDQANKKERKIKLRYFSETKREIENFFDAASHVIETHSTPFMNRVAMDNILNGCTCAADVQDKLSDFFYELKNKYGIIADENKNYYGSDTYAFNLESEVDCDDGIQESLKLISHINKLRKGKTSYEYTDSGYILITETKKTLSVSNSILEEQYKESDAERQQCGYALTTNAITNLLWYKLNSGFGGRPYPRSIDAVLKARFVLIKEISKNIVESYETMKKEYTEGKITKEQVASRILGLRSKPIRPEDLTLENLAESMDFSPQFIREYEEKVNADKRLLADKEKEIEALRLNHEFEIEKQNQTIKQMEDLIAEKDKSDQIQKSTIDELQSKLNDYEEEKAQRDKKKAKYVTCIKCIVKIIIKALCLVVPTGGLFFISKKLGWDIMEVVSMAIGVVGLIPILISIFKKDIKKMTNTLKDQE